MLLSALTICSVNAGLQLACARVDDASRQVDPTRYKRGVLSRILLMKVLLSEMQEDCRGDHKTTLFAIEPYRTAAFTKEKTESR
jgi:hypothetical protein